MRIEARHGTDGMAELAVILDDGSQQVFAVLSSALADETVTAHNADHRAKEEGYADMYSWPCEHRWINRPYLTALPVCERCGEWQS